MSLNYQRFDGELTTSGIHNDANDAVPTSDGKGTVTNSTLGEVTAEWAGNDTLRLTVTGIDLPPNAPIEVQVNLQETPADEMHSLVLRPSG